MENLPFFHHLVFCNFTSTSATNGQKHKVLLHIIDDATTATGMGLRRVNNTFDDTFDTFDTDPLINTTIKIDRMSTDIPLTQPSQFSQDEVEENYVEANGDYYKRLSYWLPAIPSMYPVQLSIVFKAGITINMNLLAKEPRYTNDNYFLATSRKVQSTCAHKVQP